MPRNLLPRLRRAPNPANIPQLSVGGWQTLTTPGDLAKLDYGSTDGEAIRTRLQSVPSPWARMLLFRNALDDSTHPARTLVENDILDGLEFLWSAPTIADGHLRTEVVRVTDLIEQSDAVGSKRVEDLGNALAELVPTAPDRSPAFTALTLVAVDGRPVLASSPYTLLFTAEDAAGDGTGRFFTFHATGENRPLSARQREFQLYIARVVLPQLRAPQPAERVDFDWVEMRRLVVGWLEREVAACPAGNDGIKTDGSEIDWSAEASARRLSRFPSSIAGIQMYQRSANVGELQSRWRIRPTRMVSAAAPLLLDRARFDGVYYEGAAPVALPADSASLDRDVLPVSGVRHPWVNPAADWFTGRLVMLDEPVDRSGVMGFEHYTSHTRSGEDTLPRMLLPLTASFFKLFAPSDLDSMLQINVDGDRVECTLRVPIGDIGDDTIEVRRVYELAQTAQTPGPSLTLWPRFRDQRWQSYVLFRRDSSPMAASLYALTALDEHGQVLKSDSERRGDVAETASFNGVPDVILVRDTINGADLGVLAPRFTVPSARMEGTLDVGIDFGTSNTVISLREGSSPAPHLLEAEDVVLPLTKQDEATRRYLRAYFFPTQVKGAPFGTAVVHSKKLQNYQLQAHGLGVRVNVPFGGDVESDDRNAVAGDLKWSSDNQGSFLTESFLRHVLALILANAIDAGFDPANVSIRYAYPRAFTERQRAQLKDLWRRVWGTFAAAGMSPRELKEPVDESVAILRHFFNAGTASVAGLTTAVLDIGGGTSDIAIYRSGETLALDSLMLGGRNLTGTRLRAGTPAELANPFVKAFAAWAEETELPRYPRAREALRTYLRDGQDHLAFSYLLGTDWYQANGYRFSGDSAAQSFQSVVLYLFGGLFYYVGMTCGEIANRSGTDTMPRKIVLAGNGGRYISWLTGGGLSQDSAFHHFFGEMVRAGAGNATAALPTIEMSTQPKEEVARGLVALTEPPLDYARTTRTTLVGERIRLSGREPFGPGSRFEDDVALQTGDVTALQWEAGTMEIERYHSALTAQLSTLVAADAHWNRTAGRLREFLGSLPAVDLQDLVRERMFYLANRSGGFRGSIFALEIAAVMDRMTDSLFR